VRQAELGAGATYEDNQLRHWAGQNGYDLAQVSGKISKPRPVEHRWHFGTALITASDIRGKTNIIPIGTATPASSSRALKATTRTARAST